MTPGGAVASVLWIYWIVLIARLVLDYVFMFARDWHPSGVVLVIVEVVYTLTDPPLRLLRRFIPSVRIGGASLDLSFLALIILVQLLIQLANRF